ncbi:ABC transporter permease [Adhaeribacter pallidiroseus]|uniref:Macrolide export ATP-binding/permease protein MacB n=1 Tax=Adhaeribacter pallidiroseus TaxID=2072847 RepID=A0A369QKX9_9BACT|nr:ABC transporter permease [Adhaeribacter pallidiroseus]RDC65551.1 Macrolide export ATP-binding/permease protein MacB [Adhaeribacter pallidiroseus]
MFYNYLKIAWRHLLRHKVFSFINIFGLAMGMAACLLIVQYVRYEWSYEDFHKNVGAIYRVTLNFYKGPEFEMADAETYRPLGPTLKAQMPEVRDFTRLHEYAGKEFGTPSRSFIERRVYVADPSVFKIFTHTFLSGNPATALSAPYQVVITASTAKKYFGNSNAVGKTLQLSRYAKKDNLIVTGVIADVPENTHLKFDILISFATLKQWGEPFDDWGGNNDYTYLWMAPHTDLNQFNQKLVLFSKSRLKHEIAVAEPLKVIHLHSHKSYEPEENGNAGTVYFLLGIAGIIILIAWINYVNLSTARAVGRAKEVGIRKVIGSTHWRLIKQFMFEALLVNALAALVTLVLLTQGLVVFRAVTRIPLLLHITSDAIFWIVFLGLFLIGSLLSGIYPALVLAAFKPVNVLKGRFSHSAHGLWLRKGLVIGQFAATILVIVATFTIHRQLTFMRQQNLGINLNQVLVVPGPRVVGSDSLNRVRGLSLKTELLRNPEIKAVTHSETLPGLGTNELNSTSILPYGASGKQQGYTYYYFAVDADFIPSLNLQIIAGRNFRANGQNQNEIIINEAAARLLGYRTPAEALGKRTTFQTSAEPNYTTIIGVVKNYHHQSLKEAYPPLVFRYYPYSTSYVSLKLNTRNMPATLKKVEASWQITFPGKTFSYFFLDEKFDQQYRADIKLNILFTFFSGLAILLACLGLFGLAFFTIVQRTKEIGIRKVLGAPMSSILFLLSKDYIKLILVANILALPLAWWGMHSWLQNYAFRIPLTAWIFVIPAFIVLLIALVSVSTQTIKIALANPVEALRNE